MQPEQTDLAITAVEPILGTLYSDIDMSKEYFKYEGDCEKQYAPTAYDYSFETKAFFADVFKLAMNLQYGPADAINIATQAAEAYRKI